MVLNPQAKDDFELRMNYAFETTVLLTSPTETKHRRNVIVTRPQYYFPSVRTPGSSPGEDRCTRTSISPPLEGFLPSVSSALANLSSTARCRSVLSLQSLLPGAACGVETRDWTRDRYML